MRSPGWTAGTTAKPGFALRVRFDYHRPMLTVEEIALRRLEEWSRADAANVDWLDSVIQHVP